MTQMTLMTLNPGYGKGISPKQRHKRHLRHYRHARMLPGVWGTPQKCVCGYPNAMLAILLLAKYVSPQIDMFGYIQETFLYGYSYLSYNEKGRTDVAMLELITLVRANCQPPSHCSIRLVQVEILVKATDQTFE